jgi:DNA-binding CsgD family transcriptional regulator
MKYKHEILRLRAEGKNYNQISNILGCSKSTVCFHCGEGQKEKSKIRSKKIHPFIKKRHRFLEITNQSNNKINPKLLNNKQILYRKIYTFTRNKNFMFTIEELMNKYEKNTICYLTGKQIDVNKPRTYEFDHIIPRSRGGNNSLDNLGLISKEANRAKSNMTPDEFLNLCKQVLEHNGYNVNKRANTET